MEGQQALNVIENLKKRVQSLRKELMEMEKVGISPDDKDYKEKYNEMKMMERAINQNKTAYINLDRTVKNLNKTTLRELQRALKECRKQMQNLSADDPKMKKLIAQYRAIDNQIGSITGQWKRQDGALKQVLSRLTAYVSIYGVYNAAKNAITKVVDASVELSDSMADIRKASGLSAEEINSLSDSLRGMDTRTTTEDLHQLAFEGARLGIQGVDGLMQFVKAGNQIRVALGEDLGEGALVELMKMNEVMGTTKELGIEKAMLATGSAINTLAASSTASGTQISDFASRLSGIATQAQITTDELLGLGSASSALNLETEVAATAFNKLISQIVSKTSLVAKASGIEYKVLDDLVKSGKSMEATVMVLEALGEKGGLRGLTPIMGDLGSNGARLNQVVAAFAENVDVLKNHLDISTSAFREATSVTNEYNIKNENAAALIKRMGNAIKDAFVSSRVVGWIEDVMRGLLLLPKTIEENKAVIIGAIAAITMALTGLEAKLMSINISFTRMGWMRMLVGLRGGFRSLVSPITAVWKLIMAHPLTVMVAAVGTFAAAVYDAGRKVDYFGKAQARMKGWANEFATETEKENTKLKQLFDWLKRAEKGSVEYNRAKNAIVQNYGGYLEALGIEIEKVEDLDTVYKNLKTSIEEAARARVGSKALETAQDAYATTSGDLYVKLKEEMMTKPGRRQKREAKSEEEVNSIIDRIRTAVDTGAQLPEDIVQYIEGFGVQKVNAAGQAWVKNAVDTYVHNLRRARSAYDQEVKDIETAYGLPVGEDATINPNPNPVVGDEWAEEAKRQEKLNAAKTEHQAVLAALEVYYAQQQQVVNQQYLDEKISVTEREKRLADIEKRMLESRIAARRALLNDPGAMEEWSAELQEMTDMNIATSDESAAALATLYGKNLHQIGEDLRKFGDGEMDGIRKNMEQDRLTIQTNAVQMRQELEQILLENDFTGKVTEEYIRSWEKLGFSMSQYKDEAEAFMRDMNTKVYPQLFDIDINTDEGLNTFKDLLLETEGYSVQLVNLGVEQMRLLYYQAIQYGDDMADATRRARKFGQRVAEERWRQSGGLAREQGLDREEQAIKDSTSLFSRVGLASENVANDMEIELYRKRMEAALQERDIVVQCGGDIEKANKKVSESIAELSSALVEKTMTQLETLKSFMDPLETLGEEMGAAFAIEDATERTDAFREAMWNAADAVADATKEMITNWVKQKIQHAINKKAIEAQEAASQATTGAIVQLGEQAKATAVQQSETQISTTKATHAATNISTAAGELGVSGPIAIAQGSAKTIGQLGWLGIPLVAVITALIGGLISWAMGKVKGAGKVATDAAPAATGKVVSGMLAYDSGNVQSVLGSDGNTYAARVGGLGSGSGIVTAPTLTNVGGQAALVGELGPEVVIGRATTRAMMQDNPRLLYSLVQFDRLHSGRGFRTYDSGNLTDFGGVDGSDNPMAASIDRMNNAIDRLNRRLEKDIVAHIVRKEVVTEAIDGMYEEKQRGRNKNLTRLLGS